MKSIIVTGSSNGLGAALMERLEDAGHQVFGYDHSLGDDVTEPSDWLADLTHVDVLINCAGVNDNRWFEEVTQASFFHLMDVNAFSMVKMTQAVLPQLIESTGTNASHIPMTSSLSYNASKAAALMITRQMAHELTPKYGITVFSVSPNKLAGTQMSKAIEDSVCRVRGWTPEYAAAYQKKALMHGLETPPAAIALMIEQLISSGNTLYLSGTDIPFGK
jgi:NAD(P)-dependent dehydrogenase (short-subunit alcohol dehydrogenase family)